VRLAASQCGKAKSYRFAFPLKIPREAQPRAEFMEGLDGKPEAFRTVLRQSRELKTAHAFAHRQKRSNSK
jgi:hypothetical protein